MNFPSKLLYYLVILPISRLPFSVLYGLSDGLYYLFYNVLGYRKKVVMDNIRRSFPNKTEAEHIKICKGFYRHFGDLMVESLKVFSISEEDVRNRMVFKNPEVIDRYFDEGRSVVLAGGHYNNWELFAVAIDANIKHRSIAIYKPLSNVFFDDKMRKTRGKYGLELVAIKEVKNTFETNRSQLTATIFGTDQSPGNPRNCYWTTFLNQDTGVLFGTEKYAREYNYPVIYGRIRKVKRGFYEFDFVDLFEFPTQTQMGEITEAHTRQLEQDIMEKPEFWLWSHRRWKHKKPTTVS